MTDSVIVRIRQGRLKGFISTTKWGNSMINFLGIPYARPPVGNLRFKPPQMPESWTGVRKASTEAHICPQQDYIFKKLLGQEDCLYLNVYTCEIPSLPNVPLKPVMVWIHGGGFTVGSGNRDFCGADYLVDSGVIIVTINYRLNVFGFLSLDNEDVPGNMGLKDQIMALHWVKNNISVFGGDPDNVTVFGESAGGASVHYLLISPLSKGLFHRAIIQSGCVLNPWAFSQTNRKRAFKLGELLGCHTQDSKVLLDFLMKADAKDIVRATTKLISKNLHSDLYFFEGIDKSIKYMAALSSEPLYYYLFKFDGSLGLSKMLSSEDNIEGACHADELPYLFRLHMRELEVDSNSPEMITLRRMVKMWTNFAKTGNPTQILDDDVMIKWKPYCISDPSYLSIDTNLSMVNYKSSRGIEFWQSITTCKL